MRIEPAFWADRKVVLTGHTGFKGAWLTLWLQRLGARVSGLALPPDATPNLYTLAAVRPESEVIADIRQPEAIAELLAAAQPTIVIHMAAQALVRRSYEDPVGTFATNVIGTAHLLDAARRVPSIGAVLVVTSDKVYENGETGRSFAEEDRLGGRDPYSASKACAELLTASFRMSFFAGPGAPAVATARAGNVIGGGDWAADRLVPDIVRAHAAGLPVALRYPRSVRPWQHVLEPLAGYLLMAQALAAASGDTVEALNFAPDAGNFRTVAELVDAFSARFDGRPGWVAAAGRHPHEARSLTLSADRAASRLGWRPQLDFTETVKWTADWYQTHRRGGDVRRATLDQIDAYSARLDAAEATEGRQTA
jgi:CDP-glucose 4,6-dehydratase